MIRGQGFLELDVSAVSVTCHIGSLIHASSSWHAKNVSLENKFEPRYLHTTKTQSSILDFARH